MNAIEMRGVCKRFAGSVAVDNLSLDVPRGSVYGFIGPNGSGKSTTLRMMMNILLPDQGSIEVLGDSSQRAARDAVGYLPEERGLYRRMKALDLLFYLGGLKGKSKRELTPKIAEWAERLEIAHKLTASVETLSKGMSQKIQFLAAVIAEPTLLILDEPFSGLDPLNMEVMQRAMISVHALGTTIVLSTHDMSVAERFCDRIFMIFRGRKVLDGTLEEIRSREGPEILRVRVPEGARAFAGFHQIQSLEDLGTEVVLRIEGDPQEFLRELSARHRVEKFEIAAPSLRDIFLRIAGEGGVGTP